MSKIYVITSGDYSDYSVINVMSTRKLAEEFKTYYNNLGSYDKCDIEEYELDKWIPQFREGLKQFGVIIDINGRVDSCEQTRGIDTWRPDVVVRTILRHKYKKNLPDWDLVKNDLDKYYVPGLYLLCWAKDRNHAIKMANEKRTALIAQDLVPGVVDIDKFIDTNGCWNAIEDFWLWKNKAS